jgi:hypothetical protein
MKLAEFTNKSHMVAHYSEFNLDSSIIDAIVLTNLIFLASMFEMPTLNTKWYLLHPSDFKEMAKIFRKQQHGVPLNRAFA